MPIRFLKESITTSDNINAISAEAERLFYRLMVKADDFGRYDGREQVILGNCFPLKIGEIPLEKIQEWLNELEKAELIIPYEAEERPYLQFRTWEKHQQKRAKKSKYPAPASNCEEPDNTCEHLKSASNCLQVQGELSASVLGLSAFVMVRSSEEKEAVKYHDEKAETYQGN
jgi:hypothetical protein